MFECFDLFCSSSLREGLPNVVLEAMAMEVPVLATRCGGIEAFGRDGTDMLTVPAGSADALAGGLRRLAKDAGLRERLAKAARARIGAEFSFRRRMERMAEVYELLWCDIEKDTIVGRSEAKRQPTSRRVCLSAAASL